MIPASPPRAPETEVGRTLPRYQGRHRQASPSLLSRGKVVIPTTAVVAGAVAAGAVSSADGATYATGDMTLRTTTVATSWDTSAAGQAASRSATRAASAVDAKVTAANSARSSAKTAALSRANAAKAAAKKKASLAALGTATQAQDYVTPATATTATTQSSGVQSTSSSSGSSQVSASGYVCPIAGCGGVFTSGFGPRSSPGGIGSTYHEGIDLATPVGTPLRAMHSGVVTAVGWYGGQGMRINIDFGNGVSVVYAHMSGFGVSVGQQVSAGQLVGWSGNTGNSTGAHLHLEVHLGGVPVNPVPWLTARGLM